MQKEGTDNLIEVYKTILEQEISNNTIFITVLLGIVVMLLGATWWWNKIGATKEIKAEVEKIFDKEKKKLQKELENEINEKTEKKIRDLKEHLLFVEADVARSMAIITSNDKYYYYSVYWWAKFLKNSLEIDSSVGIRVGVDWLLHDLKQLKNGDKDKNLQTVHQCEFVVKTTNKIPEVLEDEKKEILKICKGRKEKD